MFRFVSVFFRILNYFPFSHIRPSGMWERIETPHPPGELPPPPENMFFLRFFGFWYRFPDENQGVGIKSVKTLNKNRFSRGAGGGGSPPRGARCFGTCSCHNHKRSRLSPASLLPPEASATGRWAWPPPKVAQLARHAKRSLKEFQWGVIWENRK